MLLPNNNSNNTNKGKQYIIHDTCIIGTWWLPLSDVYVNVIAYKVDGDILQFNLIQKTHGIR